MAAAEKGAPERAPQSREYAALLAAGTAIGASLRVISLLGRGGMGEVYEVEHAALGRRFAVKVLRAPLDGNARDRFRREWRTIARLSSEYVVSVIDCGELHDGTPYLVMERLHGRDLRQLLDEAAPLPIPRAVGLIEQACLGVAAAHRAGVVHRDLKPANLFVTPRETGDELCKVLDFGVAKVETSEATQQGAVIGTVKYMAPEQLTDSASVGPAADIYALGAILYECLTGTPPHVAATLQATMFRILNESPTPLLERRANTPPELAALVERALSHDPQQRFQSAAEFSRALREFSRPAAHSARASSEGDTMAVAALDLEPERGARAGRRVTQSLPSALLALVAGFGLGVTLRTVAPGRGPESARASASTAAPTPELPAALPGFSPAPRSVTELPVGLGSPKTTPAVAVSSDRPAATPERPWPARDRKSQAPAVADTASEGEAPPKVGFQRENPYE
jgi:tRNA A-37 threonylcarbamoyl transferase component Bud32